MIHISNISELLSCFRVCCSNSCNYIVSYEETVSSLDSEVNQLKSKSEDVKREVEAARRDGLTAKNEVLGWLNSVADVEDEAQKINAKFSKMAKCLCSFPVNVKRSYQLRRRAETALATVGELRKKEFPNVADGLDIVRCIKTHNPNILGMDNVLEELQQLARGNDASIIGILGMGGVGKTALLTRFNNNFAEDDGQENPEVVIFLEVSMQYKVEELQKYICSRLNLTWQDGMTQRDRAADIFRVLSNLNFVLLLDNLWEPLNYQVVGIPFPRPKSKSKIFFTTRMEDVCSRMGAEKTVKVECLSTETAWELFSLSAKMDSLCTSSSITDKAKVLVRMCGGLPAALITVGQAMASKKTTQEWHRAANILKDAPSQIPGMEESVLHPLKLSYDHLPGDKLRKCASYFVAEGEISNAYISRLCIGEGIIDEFGNIWDAEDKSLYLLGILSEASLIQRIDNNYFKMHHMVSVMIKWVACELGKKENKWIWHDRDKLIVEAPVAEKWREAERIVLTGSKISALPANPDCPELVHLHLEENKLLKRIPEGFFSLMPRLRILNLDNTAIEDLPASICNLVFLQFLRLCGTKITSLPREFGALANLKYLSWSFARCLRRIPDQVISRLQELQCLKMSDSYNGWRVVPSQEGEAYIEELEILKKLKVLGLTLSSAAALRRVLGSKKLAATIHWLQVEGCNGLATLDIASTNFPVQSMPNILELRLRRMLELQEVTFESAALVRLQDLQLSSLPKAKIICKDAVCLQGLRTLLIEDCEKIDQLIKLEVKGKDEMETIVMFPKLKKLVLKQLPEFESLSDGNRILAFPSLEIIELKACPKLKKLTVCADKLKVIKGERSWWDELDWVDDSTKSSFLHLFKEL